MQSEEATLSPENLEEYLSQNRNCNEFVKVLNQNCGSVFGGLVQYRFPPYGCYDGQLWIDVHFIEPKPGSDVSGFPTDRLRIIKHIWVEASGETLWEINQEGLDFLEAYEFHLSDKDLRLKVPFNAILSLDNIRYREMLLTIELRSDLDCYINLTPWVVLRNLSNEQLKYIDSIEARIRFNRFRTQKIWLQPASLGFADVQPAVNTHQLYLSSFRDSITDLTFAIRNDDGWQSIIKAWKLKDGNEVIRSGTCECRDKEIGKSVFHVKNLSALKEPILEVETEISGDDLYNRYQLVAMLNEEVTLRVKEGCLDII